MNSFVFGRLDNVLHIITPSACFTASKSGDFDCTNLRIQIVPIYVYKLYQFMCRNLCIQIVPIYVYKFMYTNCTNLCIQIYV